jgi:cytochrome c oxidase cbb3-type subunit 3
MIGGHGSALAADVGRPPPDKASASKAERAAEISSIPLGDVAGAAPNTRGPTIVNPYINDAQAVQQGKQLYTEMNCGGCHGSSGTGGQGGGVPDLTDRYWRYGGTPVMIYKSIYEGRPQGMPAWHPALSSEAIWKLVAYVVSLGGAVPASMTQANIQGDRAGQNVAPDASPTVPSNVSPAPGVALATRIGVAPPPETLP